MSYSNRRRRSGVGALVVIALSFLGTLWVAEQVAGFSLGDLRLPGPGFDNEEGNDGNSGGGGGSSGNGPAILEAALEYDDESYEWGGGHPPGSFSRGEGLDCSGLINVAVMNATGVEENRVAQDFRHSDHWRRIDMSDARAGDIMYDLRDPGDSADHVAIVVENGGDGDLTIFEARTSRGPQNEEVRTSYNQSYSRFDGALRFRR